MKLLYMGCLSRANFPEMCENAKRIVNFLDSEFEVLNKVPCCGSLLHNTSTSQDQSNYMSEVYEWFKTNNISEMVTICAGCYNYLTRYYPEQFSEFNIKIQHLIQFISEPQNLEKMNLEYTGKKLTITYHDACHLRNARKPIIEEPRHILSSIKGIKYKEMDNNREESFCCGSGGGVYSSFKENSDYNSRLILDQAKRAKLLLTACPFCYTALQRVNEQYKRSRTTVMKFEDFIVKLMEGSELEV